jgi:hypothetical protein
MSRIEELDRRYRAHISAPWQTNLAGDQKALFVVYPKVDERKLRARLGLFEISTKEAGHDWRLFDFTPVFSTWMASNEYRETYFEEPENLTMKLRSTFVPYAASKLCDTLTAPEVNENTVVAAFGVASLFGFAQVSLILKEAVKNIKGRLVLFFPGEFENNNYRLLDARDGWNYLAVPITVNSGGFDS